MLVDDGVEHLLLHIVFTTEPAHIHDVGGKLGNRAIGLDIRQHIIVLSDVATFHKGVSNLVGVEPHVHHQTDGSGQ